MKDMLGNKIKVGDMVTYPVRRSSSMWMSYGRVVKCDEGIENPDPLTNHPTWQYLNPSLKVRIGPRNWWDPDAERLPRVVTVRSLDRLTIVPRSQFNEEDRTFFGLGTAIERTQRETVPPPDLNAPGRSEQSIDDYWRERMSRGGGRARG